MLETVGELGLPYIAMHGRKPQGDVIEDILDFFRDFALRAEANGVKEWILDPGFGFGKDMTQNYRLMGQLDRLLALDLPLLVGVSRKSMLWRLLGSTPEDTLHATTAMHAVALMKGASLLRVHDVAAAVQACRVVEEVLKYEKEK